MSRILVPLDFSAGTEAVLQVASDLASDLKASLLFLHIVEPVSAYVPVGASMDVIAPPPGSMEEVDLDSQRLKLEEMAAPFRSRGISVETIVLAGLASDEILTQIQVNKPRFVILASHGHGALYHLFSGSVVTSILKHSESPVVVVPARRKS